MSSCEGLTGYGRTSDNMSVFVSLSSSHLLSYSSRRSLRRTRTLACSWLYWTSRPFSISQTLRTILASMEVELAAPNGKKWIQPLGLFINNEFVKSSNEQKLASINPTYASYVLLPPASITNESSAPRRKYAQSTRPRLTTSTQPSPPHARPSRTSRGSTCPALSAAP